MEGAFCMEGAYINAASIYMRREIRPGKIRRAIRPGPPEFYPPFEGSPNHNNPPPEGVVNQGKLQGGIKIENQNRVQFHSSPPAGRPIN